jgi:hypothetical protein
MTSDPPMTAAYKYLGNATVGGKACDKFGEIDQVVNHVIVSTLRAPA